MKNLKLIFLTLLSFSFVTQNQAGFRPLVARVAPAAARGAFFIATPYLAQLAAAFTARALCGAFTAIVPVGIQGPVSATCATLVPCFAAAVSPLMTVAFVTAIAPRATEYAAATAPHLRTAASLRAGAGLCAASRLRICEIPAAAKPTASLAITELRPSTEDRNARSRVL